jgi:hypothetical protein
VAVVMAMAGNALAEPEGGDIAGPDGSIFDQVSDAYQNHQDLVDQEPAPQPQQPQGNYLPGYIPGDPPNGNAQQTFINNFDPNLEPLP